MKVLVTGAAGQLGHECIRQLEARGIISNGVDKDDFDLLDSEKVTAYVRSWQPDAIIHCAAYTQVERAETQPEVCAAINSMGTLNIARAARAVNARLMYISSDQIFSGAEASYDTDAQPCPINVYGLTKAQGEEAVRSLLQNYYIIRTGWLFGLHGSNFVKGVLRAAYNRSEITVTDAQFGSPTYAADLAALLCDMIQTNRYGVYHVTNEGSCTCADFAEEILRRSGSRCRVRHVGATPGAHTRGRQASVRLAMDSLDKAGFDRLPHWQDALDRFMAEYKKQ